MARGTGMATFFHATPRANLDSILREGLDPRYAKGGKIRGVWMCAEELIPWAILHTEAKHGVRAEEIVIIELRVSRKWMRKLRRSFWWTERNVPPARFVRVFSAVETIAAKIAA